MKSSMKKYIVHLDNWSQGPDHRRPAVPFREAHAQAASALDAPNNQRDTARLYPAGTRGWLTPGREVAALTRTPSGRLVLRVNPKVSP